MRDQQDVKTMNQVSDEAQRWGGTSLFHRYVQFRSRCVNDEGFPSV